MIKKGLGCVLVLCMLCSVALAQFSDGPVAEIEGTDWRMLDDANLLAKFEGDLIDEEVRASMGIMVFH